MNGSLLLSAGLVASACALGLVAVFLGDDEAPAAPRAQVAAALLPEAPADPEALTAPTGTVLTAPASLIDAVEADRQGSAQSVTPAEGSAGAALASAEAEAADRSLLGDHPLTRLERARQRVVLPASPAEQLAQAEAAAEREERLRQRRLERKAERARRGFGFEPNSDAARALAEVVVDDDPFADDDMEHLFD
jgi:hypothetical protein